MTERKVLCPACGSDDLTLFHEQSQVPVNSCLLLDSEADALGFPQGELRLELCGICGFITNSSFDPALTEYSSRYEETQDYSPRFREFQRDLAKRWVDSYDLHGKRVIEVGCGKGTFLIGMCEQGVGEGVGIDPAVAPDRTDNPAAQRIRWVPDFYSADYGSLDADAVVCRHTLEHIDSVGQFLRTVREGIGERTGTVVLFELPDTLRVLREAAFWDVYYEHCSYFTPGSLARLFRATGFEILSLSLAYDDQYILIEAKPATAQSDMAPLPLEDGVPHIRAATEHFQRSFSSKLGAWRQEIGEVRRTGGRVVIWGGGSKGVAYLVGLALPDAVEYAVDINPFKQGRFIAGTGQQVVSPEFLADYRPDLVIAMNPIYLNEIQKDLDALGVRARLTAV